MSNLNEKCTNSFPASKMITVCRREADRTVRISQISETAGPGSNQPRFSKANLVLRTVSQSKSGFENVEPKQIWRASIR